MPAPLRAWYTAAEIEALAARRAGLSGAYRVADMDRLVAYIVTEGGSDGGEVEVSVRLIPRTAGWLALELDLRSCLSLTCQRCLEPLALEISERVEFGVLIDEDSVGVLPDGVEPVEFDGDRLNLLQLAEDEMIVAVPMVPKHAPEHCAMDASALPDGVSAPGSTTGTH